MSWSVLDMCTIKTPFGRFSFGPTPLYNGPAQWTYVLEGPSESVGKTDKDLSPAYWLKACVGPLRPVVTHTCRWSNTVSNEALLNRSLWPGGCKAEMSRMGHLKRDIYIPYPVSGVDLWQGSNSGGSQWVVTMCCVRHQGSKARVNGSGRLRSIPLLHLFIFNSIFIFNFMPGLVYRIFFF